MNLRDLPIEAGREFFSADSEYGVLGSILFDNEALDRVADIVVAGDFYDPVHGAVFDAMSRLIASGKPADVITTMAELERSGAASSIDYQTLGSYVTHVPSARAARRYAETVAEHAMARRLQAAARYVSEISNEQAGTASDRAARAQSVIESVVSRKDGGDPKPVENFVADMLDRVQAMADGALQPAMPTRIPGIDRRLGGGLRTKKVYVIAARPSVGKSSLAGQILLNLALDNTPVAAFSLEMEESENTNRLVANLGRIDLDCLETGRLSDDDWQRLVDGVERVRNLPLYLQFRPGMTMQHLASKARLLKRKHGIRVVAIDYLQLMSSANRQLSRHHQIEEISRGLKELAGQLDLAVIVLSQLNREVEKRPSGRPVMADLKESGAAEEDADVVMLMWRHERAEPISTIGLDIAKARQGKTGEVALAFEGRYQRWTESANPLTPHQLTQKPRFRSDI